MLNQVKAPPELLEGLRRIDPAADLICVGQGFWVLGVHAPNAYARKVLEDELADDPHGAFKRREDREYHLSDRGLSAPNDSTRLELLRLYAYGTGAADSPGFKPIELYQVQRPTASIVQDFRERHHNWLTRPEQAWADTKRRASAEAGDERRMAVFRDYIESHATFWYHHVMKGARRFWQRLPFPRGA